MDPIFVSAGVMIAVEALGLVGLWLRLRSSLRQEDAHRQMLVDVVRTVPPGGALLEQRADGAALAMVVAPVPLD
ncbi:hypothetical protein [Parafrankia discariae]|uniref:hypothetical protein n=1 Tax=Parafrankia discariae TaxID=365528 RepID=UPI0003A98EAA|nr:hypothetical protein [Parafrankia discariae]